jgi:hypothetical protein
MKRLYYFDIFPFPRVLHHQPLHSQYLFLNLYTFLKRILYHGGASEPSLAYHFYTKASLSCEALFRGIQDARRAE